MAKKFEEKTKTIDPATDEILYEILKEIDKASNKPRKMSQQDKKIELETHKRTIDMNRGFTLF